MVSRTCEGDPGVYLHRLVAEQYSHTCGGDPLEKESNIGMQKVFPTHVRVILKLNNVLIQNPCILHTCEGDPEILFNIGIDNGYSPHMWGDP